MTADLRSRARPAALLALLLAAVPPLLVAHTVYRAGHDVPYWDEWQLAPLVVDAREGTVPWSALWAQHNEHRLVVGRLAMLALAGPSRWNVRWEMAASLLVQGATLVLLLALFRRSIGRVTPLLTPWFVPIATWCCFSLGAWENWIWGWQLQLVLCTFAAVAMVTVFAGWAGGWVRLLLLMLLAIGGALSFGSGLVLLGLPPLMVLVRPGPPDVARRGAQLAATLAVLVGCALCYFADFTYPAHHPSPTVALGHPWRYLEYVLAFVAGLVAADDPLGARWWGGAGIALLALAAVRVVRRTPAQRAAVVPWVLLALYVVLTAIVTGLGRTGFGTGQALSGRYLGFSALFWVSLAAVVGCDLVQTLTTDGLRERTARILIALAAGTATLVAVGYQRSWAHGAAQIHERAAVLQRGYHCLAELERAPDHCLAQLFGDTDLVRATAPRLRAHGIGPYKGGSRPVALADYERVGEAGAGGWIDAAGAGAPDTLRVSGWAVDPDGTQPASLVFVVLDGTVVARAWPGIARPDIAAQVGTPNVLYAGWEVTIPTAGLAAGRHALAAWALSANGQRIAALAGTDGFDVAR